MSGPPSQAWAWDRVPRPLREHLALILSVLVASWIALRILAVSGFQYQTAYVILQTQGTASILMGTLIPALPLIPMVAAVSCSMLGSRQHRAGGGGVKALNGLTFAFLLATTLVVPVDFLLLIPVLLLLALIGAGINKLRGRHEPVGSGDGTLVVTAIMVAALLFITVTFATEPWLPYERVGSGENAVDGWVLGSRDADIVVLRDQHRGVVVLPEGSSRTFCERPPRTTWTVPRPGWLRLTERSPVELIARTKPETECDKLGGAK